MNRSLGQPCRSEPHCVTEKLFRLDRSIRASDFPTPRNGQGSKYHESAHPAPTRHCSPCRSGTRDVATG